MKMKIRKKAGWLLALSALALLTAGRGTPWAQDSAPDYAPGEVLVQFQKDTPASARTSALQAAAARAVDFLAAPEDNWTGRPGVYLARTTIPVPQAIEILSRNPAVAFAEPNWKVYSQDLAHGPSSVEASYLRASGANPPAGPGSTANASRLSAEETPLNRAAGSDTVYVGVIDTGIQITHPNLAANIWTNPQETPDGRDNDGNGYVDDIHGWDFHDNDSSVYDGTADSQGTRVAGIICLHSKIDAGAAGMNRQVKLIPVKLLGPGGGYTADAVRALNYLRDLKIRFGLNLIATNNSWGGGGYSQSLHDAILRAAKAGMLFIAAAGNGGSDGIGDDNDLMPDYPSYYSTLTGTSTETAASYEAVIAVAAVDSSGNLASFSNYGARSVDIGAPGVGINSTLPVDSYGSGSGTSMAAPHVTGAVALLAAVDPGLTAEQVRCAVLGKAAAAASLAGKAVTGGYLKANGNSYSAVYLPPHTRVDAPASTGQIIADHTVVAQYSVIPQEYIDKVKKMWLNVPGESHSSGYRRGLQLLQNLDARFQVNVTEDGNPEPYTDQHLRVSGARRSQYNSWQYWAGESDWYTNSAGIAGIKNHLTYANTNGLAIAALGFGWCWDMTWHNTPGGTVDPVYQVRWAGASEGGPDGDMRWGLDAGDVALTGNRITMDTYLSATQEYVNHAQANGYPTKVFFTTGPVDGYSGESGYQRQLKQDYIRAYVGASSDRILFDYADILSWSNAGQQSLESWTDYGGVSRQYQIIHNDNMLNLDGTAHSEDGDHIGPRGALRLGKALWWMLARIAGWDGGGGGSTTISSTTTTTTLPPTTTTLPPTTTTLSPTTTAPSTTTTTTSTTTTSTVIPSHNIAVTRISAPSSARKGQTVYVSVTVTNQGNVPETFGVVLTVVPNQGSILPESRTISSLAAKASSTITFTWYTNGVASGSYSLKATADQIPGETNIGDNSRSTKINVR